LAKIASEYAFGAILNFAAFLDFLWLIVHSEAAESKKHDADSV
jgi:hypothetical protein